MMKTLSILTPCFNEEANIREVYERVRSVLADLGRYRYEHLFIDNASTDSTLAILKAIAREDKNVKVIANTRNFGHIRSPMHALNQARGDAVIGIVADLQDPPELIPELVRHWESGVPVVLAIKRSSKENNLMFLARRMYYRLVNRLASIETYENFTGFGLFDRKAIDYIKDLNDPYPYLRGLIAEIGLPYVKVTYDQPRREKGRTKNNWYSLYDMAMLGITNFSKVPLRIVTFSGFVCSFLCVLVAFGYFVYKLLYWDRFSVGMAPVVIGIFFFISVQLIFMGLLGEYIGSIHTLVQRRPYVFERERINFEYAPGEPLRAERPVLAQASRPPV
ncbi:MAG TPA: glycosyltransferase family 2 protein [Terriglobales bacterium]|nr:glycosyltransferase family 2 protein [Terriglobales bacterium]